MDNNMDFKSVGETETPSTRISNYFHNIVLNPLINLLQKNEEPYIKSCDEMSSKMNLQEDDCSQSDEATVSSKSYLTVSSKSLSSSPMSYKATILSSKYLAAQHNYVSDTYNENIGNEFKPKKILIVDDHKISRKFLNKLLSSRGHYCEEAANGLIGVNMVKGTFNMNTNDLYLRDYDVILMDLIMPVMDGNHATKAMREFGYKGHIIGLTACATMTDEADLLKSGCDFVLFKPCKIQMMYAILNSL